MSRCRAVVYVTGNLPHAAALSVGDAVLSAFGRLGTRPMFPSQVPQDAADAVSYISPQLCRELVCARSDPHHFAGVIVVFAVQHSPHSPPAVFACPVFND